MMVRVALDAMGGDRAPDEIVAGALAVLREKAGDIAVLLVGPEAVLPGKDGQPAGVEVVNAPEVIAMDEHPAAAVRGKPRSSIVVGVGLVKQGLADAFVSAGNSGAVMAAGLLALGRIEGVERPAIATLFPTTSGKPLLLLDVGANADCRPQHLLQFARLGADYMARVYGVERPRVGLLSIGEEPSKGNALTVEAHGLLAAAALNFVGNIEGKDIPRGVADVVVCDGFAGNVVIKTAEGSAEFIFNSLRDEVGRDLRSRLGALLLRPALRRLYRRLDYTEYGAAPLLGLRGLVMIAHGRSDRRAIASAIRAAAAAAIPLGRVGSVAPVEAATPRGESSTE